MSEPMKNSLEVQRIYFELVLRANPHDETIRFALAQVLKELGEEHAADACYDQGIAWANRQWLPRLFLFSAVTGLVSAGLWLAGVRWAWALVVIAMLGPLAWWLIRRNRQHYLPQVGFMQRAQADQEVDMAAEIERAGREE